MTEYTAKNGDSYRIHPQFDTGDLVILTGDPSAKGVLGKRKAGQASAVDDTERVAFKIKKSLLADASPVFRQMFSSDTFSGTELDLDTSHSIMRTFLLILSQIGPRFFTWEGTFDTIYFAKRYECDSVVKELLYLASKSDPGIRRIEAFALASQYNDIRSGCRMLEYGHYGDNTELIIAGDGLTLIREAELIPQRL